MDVFSDSFSVRNTGRERDRWVSLDVCKQHDLNHIIAFSTSSRMTSACAISPATAIPVFANSVVESFDSTGAATCKSIISKYGCKDKDEE